MSFTAIDFETANSKRGSVCAVGMARVVQGEIVERASWLIKPPSGFDHFEPRNIGIHGIRPQDVAMARNWEESLAGIFRFAAGGHFVAYNASFDASVMRAASEATGIHLPRHSFYCALELARGHLDLPRHKLNDVAEHLELPPFEHHEAGADAIACASVVLAIARMRSHQSVAEMWTTPIGTKRARAAEPVTTRTTGSGQNNSTAGSLRLADLPQPNMTADPAHPFFGHTFCFTGELQTFSRLDAMAAVADCGGTNRQGVTKKTTYVVLGRSDSRHSASVKDLGSSGKERKALDYMALGQVMTVLGEREFLQLLGTPSFNGNVPPQAAAPAGVNPKPTPLAHSVPSEKPARERAAYGAGAHSRRTGTEQRSEKPLWLVVLKRVLGLK